MPGKGKGKAKGLSGSVPSSNRGKAAAITGGAAGGASIAASGAAGPRAQQTFESATQASVSGGWDPIVLVFALFAGVLIGIAIFDD